MTRSLSRLLCVTVLGALGGCEDESVPGQPSCKLPKDQKRVVAIEGGSAVHLALMSDGTLVCWGDDKTNACAGERGYSGYTPWPYESDGVACLEHLSFQGRINTGITAGGDLLLWGSQADQVVGAVNSSSVGRLDLRGPTVLSAVASNAFVLVNSDAGVFWQGTIGVDEGADVLSASELTLIPFPSAVVRLAADSHACALLDTGELYCWGYSRVGQLGIGIGVSAPEPTLVPADGPIVEVVAGFWSTCVLDALGAVYCTGNNVQGLLVGSAHGDQVGQLTRVDGLPPIDRLWASDSRICGTSSGELWCLGDPPVKLEGVSDVVDVSMYTNSTCVLRDDGAVLCTGEPLGLGNCVTPVDGWHQVDFGLETCPGFTHGE